MEGTGVSRDPEDIHVQGRFLLFTYLAQGKANILVIILCKQVFFQSVAFKLPASGAVRMPQNLPGISESLA